MRMNVYDFDNTIYRGDSSVDFFRHCAVKYPRTLLSAVGALPWMLAMVLGIAEMLFGDRHEPASGLHAGPVPLGTPLIVGPAV